jgi:hypothetical protein
MALAMNAEELQALKKPVALLAEIGDHYTSKKVLVLRHGPHPLQVYLQVVGGAGLKHPSRAYCHRLMVMVMRRRRKRPMTSEMR